MITKNAISNGLFMGVIFILASYVLYLADAQSFINYKSWVLFLPFLILLFKTGTDARRNNDGLIRFGQAFKNMFFAAAIGTLICTTFEHYLFNSIDPSLIDLMKEQAVISMESMKDYADEGLVNGYIAKIQSEQLYTISYSITQYVVRLILPCAIFSALVSYIIRRDKKLLQNKKTKQ